MKCLFFAAAALFAATPAISQQGHEGHPPPTKSSPAPQAQPADSHAGHDMPVENPADARVIADPTRVMT